MHANCIFTECVLGMIDQEIGVLKNSLTIIKFVLNLHSDGNGILLIP